MAEIGPAKYDEFAATHSIDFVSVSAAAAAALAPLAVVEAGCC